MKYSLVCILFLINMVPVQKIAAMEITPGSELSSKETTIQMVNTAATELINACRSSEKCKFNLVDKKFKAFAKSAIGYNNSNSTNKLMLAERALVATPDNLGILTAGEIIKAMFNVRMPCDYGCAVVQRKDEGKAEDMSDVEVILYNDVFNALGECRLDIEENIKKFNKDIERAEPQWKRLFLLKTILGGIGLGGCCYFTATNYLSNKPQYYIGLCSTSLATVYTVWQLYWFNNYEVYIKIQKKRIEKIKEAQDDLEKLKLSFVESFRMLAGLDKYINKNTKNGFGRRIPESFMARRF